ncbi:MAG: hypothetical protein KVP17_001152 [Porospora cf. gigantea B]|uniref:uncharacterized protein n=1 Tax=Porospora cf. gigantea B TaxID=2853592 RepID=UPI003571C3C9|nr:MAG: hypothetical protein KVP17_001152 [Porospora cf. gigantea B]
MEQWTKAAIRRVIWSRKQERWLERMRHLNIPVHTCEVCSRQVTSNHRCVPTGLAVPTIEDTPYSHKELVVSQQGRNLTLKPKVVVDPNKLREEIGKMSTLLADKEALVAHREHYTEALIGLTRALVSGRLTETPQHEIPSATSYKTTTTTTTMNPARTNFAAPPVAADGTPPLTPSVFLRERTQERRPSPRVSSPLQFLTLSQGNREYYGLVDTGSQINLIDVDLVGTLRHEEVLPTTEGETEFRGIAGGSTPILGWAVLTLCLPTGEAVTTPFALVSRPPARLVLGLPFFHEGDYAPDPGSHSGHYSSPGGIERTTDAEFASSVSSVLRVS